MDVMAFASFEKVVALVKKLASQEGFASNTPNLLQIYLRMLCIASCFASRLYRCHHSFHGSLCDEVMKQSLWPPTTVMPTVLFRG